MDIFKNKKYIKGGKAIKESEYWSKLSAPVQLDKAKWTVNKQYQHIYDTNRKFSFLLLY
jgi:hypothetical protein